MQVNDDPARHRQVENLAAEPPDGSELELERLDRPQGEAERLAPDLRLLQARSCLHSDMGETSVSMLHCRCTDSIASTCSTGETTARNDADKASDSDQGDGSHLSRSG